MNKRDQQGSALLITVMLLMIIMVVALNTASLAMNGAVLSGVQERSTIAFYAAESGAERAMYDIRVREIVPAADGDVYGTVNLSNNSSYKVDYIESDPLLNTVFTSVGSFGETKRSVELRY